jgi:aconitate hydratase
MGVLPLQFLPGQSAETLDLPIDGEFAIHGLDGAPRPGQTLSLRAGTKQFQARARLDSEIELAYYRQGGILPFVLRQLLREAA